MKKILCVLAILSASISGLVSQNPYYDAVTLRKLLDDKNHWKSSDKEKIAGILGNYCPKGDIKSDILINNPFIRDFAVNIVGDFGAMAGPLNPASIASTLGGLDVTNIADGLAKFLVKRTKEELNVAFFSKFREILNDDKYRDLKTLFPATWELLDAIGDEIYNYNKYLQNLREAFQADIKALDENLPGIIPNHQKFFDDHFYYAASLNTACYITTSVKNKMHPGDILDSYPMDYLKKNKDDPGYYYKDWSGAIMTLQLISGSLRDTSEMEGKYWVGASQIRNLINDKEAFKIYLGLVYQVAKSDRYKSIPYQNGSFIDLLNKIAPPNFDPNYLAYKNYISNFAIKTDALNEMIKTYSKPANDSIAIENYTRYFKSSVDLIEYCTRISTLPYFKEIFKTDLAAELKDYFKIAYETSDLAVDINRRNYASAVNRILTIYNLVRTSILEEEYMAVARSDDKTLVEAKRDSLVASMDFLQNLARYGSFMATVATAKNSEEVESAIEAAALPAGSSRIKRETPFNVSLNAYMGLFTGYEKIVKVDDNPEFNSYGLTAPVGVAVSWGTHKFFGLPCDKKDKELSTENLLKKGGHWSYSLFASVIDLGAVAAFRVQNDSVEQVPDIKLADIFSPGIFFSIGVPKCPLSVNLGAQVGPNLRKVNVLDPETGEMVNKYHDNVYWRFSISLLVDIPIVNFYTKSR